MIIVYVHGLDSSANSNKGVSLQRYCEHHYPDIEVIRPDLNDSPDKVFKQLCDYVVDLQKKGEEVVLIGSSLGGYFSTLVSNETGCAAVLLNPSTQPHITLQRFIGNFTITNNGFSDYEHDTIIYKTTGGWDMTINDLNWFRAHKLNNARYPEKVMAFIKSGDELLNPKTAIDFYTEQDVKVDVQEGGNHRMTEFEIQLPKIMNHILTLCS